MEHLSDDELATTLGRIDTALAGIADQSIRGGVKAAFAALLTPPDPAEVVTTTTDPDTGITTQVVQPPVHVDPDTGAETPLVPRDETQDSIDPATGTLTQDAVAKRAALQKALDDDTSELARDTTDLADLDAKREAKLGEIADDQALIGKDQAALDADAAAAQANADANPDDADAQLAAADAQEKADAGPVDVPAVVPAEEGDQTGATTLGGDAMVVADPADPAIVPSSEQTFPAPNSNVTTTDDLKGPAADAQAVEDAQAEGSNG